MRANLPLKILVVDDDLVSSMALATVLRRLPQAEVVEAHDGEAAWELLAGGLRPSLCCSDIHMPRLGGIDLMRRAREHPVLWTLPFVMITGSADVPTVKAAISQRAGGFIVKPFNATETRATVERLARAAQAGQAERPRATCTRLGLDNASLVKMLGVVVQEAQGLDPATGGEAALAGLATRLARLRTASQTLGLWQAQVLLERLLAGGPPQAAACHAVLAEVAWLARAQLALLEADGPAAPAPGPAPGAAAHHQDQLLPSG